jgi:glucans biosynthesis protein C
MISGCFVARSYDLKGFGGFEGERFKRLVVPTLIFMIAITPFIEIIELGSKATGFNLIDFLSGTGPMWFAAALFGFCLIYGLVRLMSRRSASAPDRKRLELTRGMVVSLILINSVFAFLIRIVLPIWTSILNFQLCYFPLIHSPFHSWHNCCKFVVAESATLGDRSWPTGCGAVVI